MKWTIGLASIILMLAPGCSSVREIDLGQKDEWFADARGDLANEKATVTTRDYVTYNGKILRLDVDSLELQDEKAGLVYAVPMDYVKTIQPELNIGAP